MTEAPCGRSLCDDGGMRMRLTGEALPGCNDAEEVMLVWMALANKMARIAWAVMTKNEDYRAPAAVAA